MGRWRRRAEGAERRRPGSLRSSIGRGAPRIFWGPDDASTTKHHAGLGTVEARSEGEGRRATFEVVLPVRGGVTAEGRDGIVSSIVPQPPVEIARRERLKGVVQASSAKSALKILTTSEISAIVSDIGMPGADGYAFVRSVRATPATAAIPAHALTAYVSAEDREKALASGFADHVAKPIDPIGLVAAVAALVGQP